MARLWRAFHAELPGAAGEVLQLERDEAEHVGKVLRLGVGERIALFDGAGVEWEASIRTVAQGRVEARLERRLESPVESPLEVVLFQGLCKADRMEWVVQKATELGVNACYLLPSARSERHLPNARRLARWRRIAVEACKQSGRRVVPRVELQQELPSVDDTETLALLLDPDPGGEPLGRFTLHGVPRRVWIAVGPESGFEASEAEAAIDRGWHGVGLGPRILRTETAGLVAATIVLHRWSDLGSAARTRVDSDPERP